MTLIACWVKTYKLSPQLVIASDSMLSMGERWPCCPKIFKFDRQDCVICFSGNTFFTYPIMLQIHSTINMNEKFRSRALDIHDLVSVIIDIVNLMINERRDGPSTGLEEPESEFLFGGYSWKYHKFKAWNIYYDKNRKYFTSKVVIDDKKNKLFYFQGDNQYQATGKMLQLTENLNFPIDMNPLKILLHYINSNSRDDSCIGGAPQIMIISSHMNALPYNVYWPNKKIGKLTFLGRPLLDIEKNKYLALDPETMIVYENPFIKEATKPIVSIDNKKNLRYMLLLKLNEFKNRKMC